MHSIELVFDAETETTIRRIWADLAAAGVPSQAPAARPHVTLAVAARIDPQVDALLAALTPRFPLECTVGAPVLFGRSHAVLARQVVPTVDLLTLQSEVHRLCLPHLASGPLPHTEPGQWSAHVTLARHVGPRQLGRALRIGGRPTAIPGRFTGLRRWQGDKRTEHPIG